MAKLWAAIASRTKLQRVFNSRGHSTNGLLGEYFRTTSGRTTVSIGLLGVLSAGGATYCYYKYSLNQETLPQFPFLATVTNLTNCESTNNVIEDVLSEAEIKEIEKIKSKIKQAKTAADFRVIYDSENFQNALLRLEKARDGRLPEVWSKAWALRMRQGDASDVRLNRDRKLCLSLLYKMCDCWKPKQGESTISERDILSDFKDHSIHRILAVCLVMDRANALYHMQYHPGDDHGMHWVSEIHLERSKEWRSTVGEVTRPTEWREIVGDSKCPMNKRLVRLFEMEGLSVLRNDPLISKWMEPKLKPWSPQKGDDRKRPLEPKPNVFTLAHSENTWTRPTSALKGLREQFYDSVQVVLRCIRICFPFSSNNTWMTEVLCPECETSPVLENWDKTELESRCITNLMQLGRVCKTQNAKKGLILFRGGKTYAEEKSTLMRCADKEYELKKLLMSIYELKNEFRMDTQQEGRQLLVHDDDCIVTTIRCLALLQHYGVLDPTGKSPRFVNTPLLDATKSPRVAASFAFMGDEPSGDLSRALRILLVGQPKPLDKNSVVGKAMKEEGLEWLIFQLGESEMLLIELEPLLPVTARRPQNQLGYILVHQRDLFAIHTLCKKMASSKHKPDYDKILEDTAARDFINNDGWNALDYEHKTVVLDGDTGERGFFHARTQAQYMTEELYPENDPTLNAVRKVAKRVKDLSTERAG